MTPSPKTLAIPFTSPKMLTILASANTAISDALQPDWLTAFRVGMRTEVTKITAKTICITPLNTPIVNFHLARSP